MKDIKLGDSVSLIDMEILERRGNEFICQFMVGNDPVYYSIPIFLAGLNIRFKEVSFVMPGGGVSASHPDYFKFHSTDTATKQAVYLKEGRLCKIKLDEEFHLTGKYYVTRSGDITDIHYAQLMTDEFREAQINAWVNTEVNYGNIRGHVVRIYIKEYTKNPENIMELSDILYLNNTEEAHFYSASDEEIFVVIHDEGGDMEYTVPLNLINKI